MGQLHIVSLRTGSFYFFLIFIEFKWMFFFNEWIDLSYVWTQHNTLSKHQTTNFCYFYLLFSPSIWETCGWLNGLNHILFKSLSSTDTLELHFIHRIWARFLECIIMSAYAAPGAIPIEVFWRTVMLGVKSTHIKHRSHALVVRLRQTRFRCNFLEVLCNRL